MFVAGLPHPPAPLSKNWRGGGLFSDGFGWKLLLKTQTISCHGWRIRRGWLKIRVAIVSYYR